MRLVVTCLLVASTSAVAVEQKNAHAALRQGHVGKSFISSLQFNHILRLCNAYPMSAALDVFVGKGKLTKSPMPYKQCEEFRVGQDLKAGDKIDFKVGESSAGSFSVSELPNNDAVLVLVIYRHDAISTGVSFESHVFSSVLNAQVAVIDTFRGAAKGIPHIQDVKQHNDPNHVQRSEELRYNSVMAVNPGVYEVHLQDDAGKVKASQELIAINRESYMVMRVGVEAQQGQAYPEELMIFPMSDRAKLQGAATSMHLGFATALAAVLTMVCGA